MRTDTSSAQQPRVRGAAIILQEDALLVVRHDKGNGQTYWLLPGGGVEYGESMSEALEREVLEETGLAIEVGDLALAHDTIAPDGSRHVVNLYFTAEVIGGEIRTGDEDILAEVRFAPLAELDSLDLRPDISAHLLAACRDGLGNRAPYLGRIWRP